MRRERVALNDYSLGVAEASGSVDFLVDFLVDFVVVESVGVSLFSFLVSVVVVFLSDFLEVGSSAFDFSRAAASCCAFSCEVPDISAGGTLVVVETLGEVFGAALTGAVGSGFTDVLGAGVGEAYGAAVAEALGFPGGERLALGATVGTLELVVVVAGLVVVDKFTSALIRGAVTP